MDALQAREWLDGVVHFAAFPVITALGLVVAIALTGMGRWRDGVRLGLEFWVAAGLLGLTAATTWRAIALAAIIITVRQVVTRAMARASAARNAARGTP